MKRLLAGFFLALVGVLSTTGMARADGDYPCPWARSAAFPTVTPPGWYTNVYKYDWRYPWYAYYNHSQGPYANWLLAQGHAGYANQKRTPPIPMPAEVTVVMPEDGTLSFSGVVAEGTGDVRTFTTPVLSLAVEYGYEMTVEVVRNGKPVKVTKMVAVHAGEDLKVVFEFPEVKIVIPPPKMVPPPGLVPPPQKK